MTDQRSCFNKRMGKKVLGDNITIHDDVYHPLQSGAPYDGEGIPRQKVLLLDKGVPQQSGLLARHGQKNESQAHRPRLFLAQR